MKHLLFVLAFTIALAGCSKEKAGTTENTVVATGDTKFTGTFSGASGYTASGTVKVLLNGTTHTLLFEPFTGSAGPDLKVYLSKRDTPFEFINLGNLKSNTGSQSYAVPQGTDFTVYKYALIHCQQFNKLFAVAELKP